MANRYRSDTDTDTAGLTSLHNDIMTAMELRKTKFHQRLQPKVANLS